MIFLGVTALLLLQAGSCPSLEVQRPYAAPTAAEVVATIKRRGQAVRSVRAESRMSHRTDQGKMKATVRLMASRGGKLRFDAVTPFDTPLATLVCNGRRFSLLDAQKNRHYHGPATPCNIARLLQVALEPGDVLTILGGATPLISYTSATLRWDGRDSVEVLTLRSKTLVQTIRLHGADRRWDLQRSEIRSAKGELLLQIKSRDYHTVGPVRLPRRLSVSQPKQSAKLDVTFKRQEVNKDLPEAAFELSKPNGLPSQHVDCSTVIRR